MTEIGSSALQGNGSALGGTVLVGWVTVRILDGGTGGYEQGFAGTYLRAGEGMSNGGSVVAPDDLSYVEWLVAPVPEPGTATLLALGLVRLGFVTRR